MLLHTYLAEIDMHFRIGDAAKQTGLTAHVLRQWSKRYGLNPSVISDGGHRLYSSDDVRRLTLVKRAKSRGMLLSELATLSVSSLEAITEEVRPSRPVFWQGPAKNRFKSQFARLTWLTANELKNNPSALFIFQEDTITEEWLRTLPIVGERDAYIFYEYASRPHIKLLAEMGYECIKGEPTFEWFKETVEPSYTARDFSPKDIDRLIQTEAKLDCECPARLAKIVKQLRGYAEYSLECKTPSEKQAWLHRRVFEHIRKAQVEIEQSLALIAREESL